MKFLGCPRKFYHWFMHIAPSIGHLLMNLYLPFKVILRFEVIFCSLHFLKDYSHPPILYHGFIKRMKVRSRLELQRVWLLYLTRDIQHSSKQNIIKYSSHNMREILQIGENCGNRVNLMFEKCGS